MARDLIFIEGKRLIHDTNSTQNKRTRGCRRANLDEMTTNSYPVCYNSLDRLSVGYAINAINKDRATHLFQTDEGQKQLSPENRAVAVTEDLLTLGRKAFYSETFGNEVFQKDAVGALDSPINPVTLQNSSTKFTQRPMNPV